MSIQDKAQHQISQLDKELGKHEFLNNFERQTNVPKVYVVLGLGALYFFLIFFNIGANFLINTIGFALPAYYSLDALFTTGKADDTQWLTYWVVYAFLTFFESAVNAVYWFPFYIPSSSCLCFGWRFLRPTAPKSSSAPSSSPSSPATSPAAPPPPTSAPPPKRRNRVLVPPASTRICSRICDKTCRLVSMSSRTMCASLWKRGRRV